MGLPLIYSEEHPKISQERTVFIIEGRFSKRTMKLAHYVKEDQNVHVGLVRGDRIYDVSQMSSLFGINSLKDVGTIDELLMSGLLEPASRLDRELGRTEDNNSEKPEVVGTVDNTKLKSPILNPEKILMIAINYGSHSREQNEKPPEEPYVFTKFRNALVGPTDLIIIPKISKEVDWEAELAVVIGKKGKYIPKDEAMSYVAGYSVANDVSFRDRQYWKNLSTKSTLGSNWFKGKGLDNALPLGPWLVTRDEINNPYSCEISLTVNGITRQKSLVEDMLFKIDELIEYVSGGVTLRPGDIICTGTPMGVAAFTGVPYLKAGDLVEARISGIGSLKNPVIAEPY